MHTISMYSNNKPDHYIVERAGVADIATIQTDQDRQDATFVWTGAGLVLGPGVTSAGFGQKGQLRRAGSPEGFVLMIATFDDFRIHGKYADGIVDPAVAAEVRRDSTFVLEKGLIDPNQVSFRSVQYPDRYIRHRGNMLFAETVRTPGDYQTATFRMTWPLTGAVNDVEGAAATPSPA